MLDSKLEVIAVEALTPHDEALLEAGKELLVESLSVGREFCKFMITTALSAVPVYVALLKLVFSDKYTLATTGQIWLMVPVAAFFLAAALFTVAYFPAKCTLELDIPESIDQARTSIIARRNRCSVLAFVILLVGMLIAAWMITGAIVTPAPE